MTLNQETYSEDFTRIEAYIQKHAKRYPMALGKVLECIAEIKEMPVKDAIKPYVADSGKLIVEMMDETLTLMDLDRWAKYPSFAEALKHYVAGNVLISIGNVCYIFREYKFYKEFNEDVGTTKFHNDKYNFDHLLCMYYVVPLNITHNPVLLYKSTDDEELAIIKQHIAKFFNTHENLIECVPNDDESYLKLNGIKGNYQGYFEQLATCVMKAKDDKLELLETKTIEGCRSYMLPVIANLMKSAKIPEGTNIQNLTIVVQTGANPSNHIHMTSADKKQSRNATATLWISQNTPSGKQTPTKYHEKYVKAHANGKVLSLSKFNDLMKDLGYKMVRNCNNRHWKFTNEASDSDE